MELHIGYCYLCYHPRPKKSKVTLAKNYALLLVNLKFFWRDGIHIVLPHFAVSKWAGVAHFVSPKSGPNRPILLFWSGITMMLRLNVHLVQQPYYLWYFQFLIIYRMLTKWGEEVCGGLGDSFLALNSQLCMNSVVFEIPFYHKMRCAGPIQNGCHLDSYPLC